VAGFRQCRNSHIPTVGALWLPFSRADLEIQKTSERTRDAVARADAYLSLNARFRESRTAASGPKRNLILTPKQSPVRRMRDAFTNQGDAKQKNRSQLSDAMGAPTCQRWQAHPTAQIYPFSSLRLMPTTSISPGYLRRRGLSE
jgi:hypothetical protein